MPKSEIKPVYSKWRHGGWYVLNARYPGGCVGCVSNNYADGKWRRVEGPHEETFKTRHLAALHDIKLSLAAKDKSVIELAINTLSGE